MGDYKVGEIVSERERERDGMVEKKEGNQLIV